MPKVSSNYIPSYRRHKATGQAVVTLAGKDVYLGKHGTKDSKAEYGRIVAEWLANGRRLPDADAALSVAELILAFWPHVETHYRRSDGLLCQMDRAGIEPAT